MSVQFVAIELCHLRRGITTSAPAAELNSARTMWISPMRNSAPGGSMAECAGLARRRRPRRSGRLCSSCLPPDSVFTLRRGTDARIQKVRVTKDQIIAGLADGRVISVPLAWSWRLCEATPVQRARFRLIGTGQGIHWPDVDEDISVEGLLHGTPAPRPNTRAAAVKVRVQRPPAPAPQSTGKRRRSINAGR